MKQLRIKNLWVAAALMVSATAPLAHGEEELRAQSIGLYGGAPRALLAEANDGTVFLSESQDGLFCSKNSGTNWKRVDASSVRRPVAMVKGASNAMYIIADGGSSLLASTDACNTFSNLRTGSLENKFTAIDFRGAVLLVGQRDGTILRSTDGGKTFAKILIGLAVTNGNGIGSIASSAFEKDTFYATVQVTKSPVIYRVYKSTDGGQHWKALDKIASGPGLDINQDLGDLYLNSLERSVDGGKSWHPFGPNFPASASNIPPFSAAAGKIYFGPNVSPDNGLTWAGFNPLSPRQAANPTGQVLQLSGKTLLAPSYVGLSRSTDNGLTWVPSATGIDAGGVDKLEINSSSKVATALLGGRVVTSADATTNSPHWAAVNNFTPDFVRDNEGALYTALGSMVVRSPDNGATFFAVSINAKGDETIRFLASTADGTIFAATEDPRTYTIGIYESHDKGLSWKASPQFSSKPGWLRGLKGIGNQLYLSVSPAYGLPSNGVEGFYLLEGETWKKVSTSDQSNCAPLHISAVGDDLYAAGLEKASLGFTGCFLTSADKGKTWTNQTNLVGSTILNGINAVAVDDQHPSVIYIAIGKSILKSADKGATWNQFFVMPSYVADLQTVDGSIFVATQTGAYRLVPKSTPQFIENAMSYIFPKGNVIMDWDDVPQNPSPSRYELKAKVRRIAGEKSMRRLEAQLMIDGTPGVGSRIQFSCSNKKTLRTAQLIVRRTNSRGKTSLRAKVGDKCLVRAFDLPKTQGTSRRVKIR